MKQRIRTVLLLLALVVVSAVTVACDTAQTKAVQDDIGQTIFMPNAPVAFTKATISHGSILGNVSAVIIVPLPEGAENAYIDIPKPGESRLFTIRYLLNGVPAMIVFPDPVNFIGRTCNGDSGRAWLTEHGYCIDKVTGVVPVASGVVKR